MKKLNKRVIGIAVIFIIILFMYSYFNVKGKDIEGVSKISSDCSVSIVKSYHLDNNQKEYILNAQQIDMLKNLILVSDFTRKLSSTVQFNDKDRYEIKIDFNNAQDFLMIDCIGNEYISVTNQFNGKHLKINNSDWKATLEQIISLYD